MSNETEGSSSNLLIRNRTQLLVLEICVHDLVSFNQSKSDIPEKIQDGIGTGTSQTYT